MLNAPPVLLDLVRLALAYVTDRVTHTYRSHPPTQHYYPSPHPRISVENRRVSSFVRHRGVPHRGPCVVGGEYFVIILRGTRYHCFHTVEIGLTLAP